MKALPLTSSLVFLFFISPSSADIIYKIQTKPDAPSKVEILIDTKNLGPLTFEPSRKAPGPSKRQAVELNCLQADGSSRPVHYNKTIQCEKVSWEVSFKKLDKLGTDVSEQQNAYSVNGLKVFFEWDNLPRIKEFKNIQVCVKGLQKSICQSLPSVSSAPLIMAWGVNPIHLKEGNFSVNIYKDSDLLDEQFPEMVNAMDRGIKYLTPILGKEKAPVKFDLVFVKIDKSVGRFGAAAGNNGFVANYITSNGALDLPHFYRLKHLALHETIHSINGIPLSTWAGESLAEYYAHKVMGQIEQGYQTAIEEWQTNKPKFKAIEVNMLEANEMVKNNNYSVYGLFYDKGAAFWNELDNALMEKGASLDDVIKYMSKDVITAGDIPKPFIEKVEVMIGKEKWQRLYEEYIK
jgi:hypothetical protein